MHLVTSYVVAVKGFAIGMVIGAGLAYYVKQRRTDQMGERNGL